ncbi:hypothetical protein D3OALGA1CA_1875 [Olavius algarvensis associated proteobacterium Delta 3]|nr:hypothetical protein D3OALGA1CA_1875 [Olavius algarvensis associated proteobacterium Delta 3]CAB5135252.1 hypothetical protein D3OALGB2SA_3888 [Olavius algarvensis associated proteobacterium Delta 3]
MIFTWAQPTVIPELFFSYIRHYQSLSDKTNGVEATSGRHRVWIL